MKFFNLFLLIAFISIVSCDNNESILDGIPTSSLPVLAEKMKDSIQIIAHGGASEYEPYNSIASFKKAFELSADGIELDLMVSIDDSIMVFHDVNTKAITGVDYNMVNTSADVLRTLNIGKGKKMPFLNEVFRILPTGKKIFLEVKWWQVWSASINSGLIDNLINQIEKSGRINDCVIICLDENYLKKIKLRKPALNCFLATYDIKLVKEADVILNKNKFSGCNILWNLIDVELAKKMKVNNKTLFAFTVNDGETASKLYREFKINGIYTDKPDVIRYALSRFF
jgi:glycerophosphoryl diester phosphodiesterase